MKRIALIVTIAVAGSLAITALVSAQTGSRHAHAANVAARSTPLPAKVMLRTTPLGRILVDRLGRTLYLFEKDRNGRSSCYGECAKAWPPVTTTGTPVAGRGISASKLNTVRRTSGKRQVTYNGHPLYRFFNDKRPGDTTGQGLDNFGALWYVLSASGRRIVAGGGGTY